MTATIGDEATAFLQARRLGMFSTAVGEGWSRPVPVWYDWDGQTVTVFSFREAPKVKRLQAEPRAHILMANHPDENEHWVSIAGPVELFDVDPDWLGRVAGRYWDLDDPARGDVVREWQANVASLISLRITPTAVHVYGF